MRSLQWLQLLLLSSASIAAPASSTSTAVASQSTACGTIVNSQDTLLFNASLAYECLTSVPFNPAVATRFLKYYNDTLQFQSTLTYLKNPPSSYQQPATDLIGGLDHLQQQINIGAFANEYEFEAALQVLIYSAHDFHLDLLAGILSAFSFASPYDIISVSLDGVQLPKVYLAVDLVYSSYFTTYQPSAISTINGVDATTYLTQFAANNSYGTLEPHTDWNQLMLSPALDIQGYFDIFSGDATFYPGDTITFALENGTEITDYFLAIYNSPGPTGPLETGGDFYNFFVLGFYPASFDPSEDDDTTATSAPSAAATSSTSPSAATSTAPTPLSWNNSAYPLIPDVAQPDLGTYGEGYVSGYFLNSTSIAVLSIPSFDASDDAVGTFQDTITQFINQSKAAGLKKVVIDLQQNFGGSPILAIDTFKQFFPNIDPFAGSRMRAQPYANLMGETITDYWDSLDGSDDNFYVLAGSEWVSTFRLNANTNQNFTSWAEFFGPHLYNGDNFTTTQRYNLSSALFDEAATHDEDSDFAVFGYSANPAPPNAKPPYAAEDIILLSDGICVSACAIFAEAMNHDAGVRVVVAGGRPVSGPMQAPSGSRGARLYSLGTLDANIEFAQEILAAESPPSPDVNLLPNRTADLDVFIVDGSVNLRDQVRSIEETTPLQFAYEAADCRIWFTPQTVYNYTALWQYAADAIWSKPSLCVAGSTGFATTGTNKTNFVGPGSNSNNSSDFNSTNTSPSSPFTGTSHSVNITDGGNLTLPSGVLDPLSDAGFRPRNAVPPLKPCTSSNTCGSGFTCASVPTCLSSGKTGNTLQCVPRCFAALSPCAGGGRCSLTKAVGGGVAVGSQTLQEGVCIPPVPAGSGGGKCGVTGKGQVKVGPAPPSKRGEE